MNDIAIWLKKGEEDLKTARILFENSRYDDCAVYCHQAVEKGLKSLFLKTKGEVPKIHDLSNLAKKLNLPPALLDHCVRLTPLYFAARYPDAPGYSEKMFTKKDCQNFLKFSEEILLWIKK